MQELAIQPNTVTYSSMTSNIILSCFCDETIKPSHADFVMGQLLVRPTQFVWIPESM